VVAESSVPLPLSAELTFRVEETGPRTILKMIPLEGAEEQKMVSFLKKALSTDIPLDQLARNLSDLERLPWLPPGEKEPWKQFFHLLKQFSPAELLSQGPPLLPRLFSQSGFFWENKIRRWLEGGGKGAPDILVEEDLKGLSAKLLAQVRELAASSALEGKELLKIENLRQALDSFLQKIELHQVLNLKPSDSADPFYFFLPFWMENQLQFVEFNLSLPSKNSPSGERDGFSILFLLRLPAFGEVRIEVRMRGKALFCRFVVSGEEVSEFLRQGIPLLQERLERMGFQPLIETTAQTGEKDKVPSPLETEGESQALLSILI